MKSGSGTNAEPFSVLVWLLADSANTRDAIKHYTTQLLCCQGLVLVNLRNLRIFFEILEIVVKTHSILFQYAREIRILLDKDILL